MPDQPPPPPVPPKPVSPLPYASPVVASGRRSPSFYHQAAKAAWVAPLVALLIGVLTRESRDANRTLGIAIGVLNALIITAGFALGVVALFGVKRHGASRIVFPALCGLVINGVMIATVVAALVARPRGFGPPGAAGSTLRTKPPVPFSSPQSPLRQTGWVGVGASGPTLFTFMFMDDEHPETKDFRRDVRADAGIILIAIDNRGGTAAISVDTNGAALELDGDRTLDALDQAAIAKGSGLRPASINAMTPPFNIAAGALVEGKILFVPRGFDPSSLRAIRVRVNGDTVRIPGRIMTAEEKTAAYEHGNATTKQ